MRTKKNRQPDTMKKQIHLPEDFHDEDAFDKIRSVDKVARRCIVLYAVSAAGNDEPRDKLCGWLRREGLWDFVSPKEAEFLLAESPTQKQIIDASWRVEALLFLLWSLGLIPELPSPQQLCDLQLIQRVLPALFEPVAGFICSARLRSDSEIFAANEEIWNIHWRVRNARLHPENFPPMPIEDCEPLLESVVQERHHALNWLIGYGGYHWDHVKTDT